MQNEWPYLSTPEAKARYVIAAKYLQDCANILEIGGYVTPIHEFLDESPKTVWGFDPKAPQVDLVFGKEKSIQVHRKQSRFQTAEMPFEKNSYGLVLIGCSLKFDKKDPNDKTEGMGKLVDWAVGAKTIILEYAKNWQPALEVAESFSRLSSHRQVLNLGMTIPVLPPDEPHFGNRVLQIWNQK